MTVASTAPSSRRRAALAAVGWNVALLPADAVAIDVRTDSWAELPLPTAGPRTAAASPEERIAALLGHRHALALPRGRAADAIVAAAVARPGARVLTNALFPTARFHLASRGVDVVEAPIAGGGDLDPAALDAALADGRTPLAAVWLEASCNALGGAIVTRAGLARAHERCAAAGVPVVLDATRLFDNATLDGDIDAAAYAAHVDLCVLSASKAFASDGGGFVATSRDAWWPVAQDLGLAFAGGLPLAQRERLAHALAEDPAPRCRRRVAMVARLRAALAGAPMLAPGAHAVVLDARRLLSDVPADAAPAQTLLAALHLAGGVRASEHLASAADERAGAQLVRLTLAVGGRDDDATIAAIAEAVREAPAIARRLGGLRVVRRGPGLIGRHATAYAPLAEA